MPENLCKLEPLVQSYTKLQWQIVEELFLRIDTLTSEELHTLNIAKNNLEFLMVGGEIPEGDRAKFPNILSLLEERVRFKLKLTKYDLELMYGLVAIEGVAIDDPRLVELQEGRNKESDMLIIFECTQDQIAHSSNEITKNTKAYVGPLEVDMLKNLPPTIEHIYTTFPEGRIQKRQIEIGGQTVEELITSLEAQGYKITDTAKYMMRNIEFKTSIYTDKNFTILKPKEPINLIQLSVADLGFSSAATTTQIFEKAQELGLVPCPPEVGPYLRMQYKNQPMSEWIRVGMERISDSGGNPRVFCVGLDGGKSWLDDDWTGPDSRWGSSSRWVFGVHVGK